VSHLPAFIFLPPFFLPSSFFLLDSSTSLTEA
jgi:hypothetical protein